MTQMEYLKQQLLAVLAIDSPTGHTAAAAQYVLGQYRALGFSPVLTNKGGVLVCVNEGCPGGEGGLLLEAHLDTLGAMVAEIKPNGRLRLTPLGGLNANNTEAENVRLSTRSGKVFSGTFQLKNASVHVNGEYSNEKRTFDSMELVLDEDVASKEDVLALGIRTGDIACFDARTTITESGYIKSRFLDDWHRPRALPGVPKNRRAPFGTISLCLKRWATAAAPVCRRASPRPSASIWAA